MLRTSVAAAVVAALTLVFGAAAFAHTSATKLQGKVGPGFSISLKMNGHVVKKLKAGTYTFVVSDKASIHNFTLEQEKGGKFDKDLTSVGFVGTKTVKVKLKAGKWKYYCTPHESQMFGFFTVT